MLQIVGCHKVCSGNTTSNRRTSSVLGLFTLALSLIGSGCGTIREPYSAIDQAGARIAGMDRIRAWADSPGPLFFGRGMSAMPTMLALSGGGAEGAFGAGFLKGWSHTDRRPPFGIVIGTSVGALMAPFAFLGADYNSALEEIFTNGQMESLLRFDGVSGLFASGVYQTEPLKQLIAHYCDDTLLDAIAHEYRKGRFLFIITANIDAQRAVIWNMTAIAASDQPERLDLFRRLLIASASIPGVFAPTFIDVETGGKRFAEMHVDGSVISSVPAVQEVALLGKLPKPASVRPKIYVIINGKLEPDFDVVAGGTLSIVARSFWTTVKANTRNALIRTYELAQRNNWEFRSTAIEPDRVIATSSFNFDTAYLRNLFGYGYERGRSGKAWQTALP
jgi:predicted patatin/cPLA2 family phospholipase